MPHTPQDVPERLQTSPQLNRLLRQSLSDRPQGETPGLEVPPPPRLEDLPVPGPPEERGTGRRVRIPVTSQRRDPMAVEVREGKLVTPKDAFNIPEFGQRLEPSEQPVNKKGGTDISSLTGSEQFDIGELGFTTENGRITDVPEGGGFLEIADGRKAFLLPGGRIVDETGAELAGARQTPTQRKANDPFAPVGGPQNAKEEFIAREALNDRNRKLAEVDAATTKTAVDVRSIRRQQSDMVRRAKTFNTAAKGMRAQAKRLEGTRNRKDAIRASRLKASADKIEGQAAELLSGQEAANGRIRSIVQDNNRLSASKRQAGLGEIQEANLKIKVEREKATNAFNRPVSNLLKIAEADLSTAKRNLGQVIAKLNKQEIGGKTKKTGRFKDPLTLVRDPDDPTGVSFINRATGEKVGVGDLTEAGATKTLKDRDRILERMRDIEVLNRKVDDIRIQQLGAPPEGVRFEDWIAAVKEIRDSMNITELEAVDMLKEADRALPVE